MESDLGDMTINANEKMMHRAVDILNTAVIVIIALLIFKMNEINVIITNCI